MINKANLLNQSTFLLGVPGSGKSFSAKELITFLALRFYIPQIFYFVLSKA